MAEFLVSSHASPTRSGARFVAGTKLLRRSSLLGALAALGSASAALAQSQPRQPSSISSAPSQAVRGLAALMSRPRWEVNGSSIAPPAVTLLPERAAPTAALRASHSWFADEAAASGRLRLAMAPRSGQQSSARAPRSSLATPVAMTSGSRPRLMGAEQDETPITMSVSGPGSAPQDSSSRVTMRMEVPVPGDASPSGQVIGGHTSGLGMNSGQLSSGSGAPIENAARAKARERQASIASQEQFDRAKVVKAEKNRLLLAQASLELDRAQRRTDRAKSGLDESIHDLDQFRGVLQKAFLEAGPDATGLNPFVRTAQRYAGTPYVWGGESRNGFDCSGFIIVVMRDLGYKALPHSAAEQFNYGLPIAKSLLKPGDLVFFQNTYKPGISHVGIYLGQGRFIQAAGTGKGTIVSYLSESPYAQKYAGARRLFKTGN